MSTNRIVGLRIDLYDGAYGQTLRIATRNSEALMLLRHMFESLAEEKTNQLVLGNNQGTSLENCAELYLLLSEQDAKRVDLRIDETGTKVAWVQPAIEWRDACDLVDGLVQHGHGHQYLTEMERTPIIIELSYRE